MATLQSLLFVDNQQIVQAARNNPALRQGSQGDGVRALQLALYALGFRLPISVRQNPLSADSIFGPETAGAVQEFQRRNNLTVDGIAGMHTIAALDQLLILTGRDPIRQAVYDLQQLASKMGTALIKGQESTQGQEFTNRLADVNSLTIGNPVRFLVRIRQLIGQGDKGPLESSPRAGFGVGLLRGVRTGLLREVRPCFRFSRG
jgi:peptidoglycan hydrolase-like protein with peptidoglycan-binding domain